MVIELAELLKIVTFCPEVNVPVFRVTPAVVLMHLPASEDNMMYEVDCVFRGTALTLPSESSMVLPVIELEPVMVPENVAAPVVAVVPENVELPLAVKVEKEPEAATPLTVPSLKLCQDAAPVPDVVTA
jgi:hypothetical protein